MALKKEELSELVASLILEVGKLNFSSLKIGVLNHKGGVGKSVITMQIALTFGLEIVDIDSYGTLETRLENVSSFEEKEDLYLPESGYVIDFGGYAHELEDDIIAELDVIVVPYYPDDLNVTTTYNMLEGFEDNNTPIIFVANRIKHGKDEKLSRSAYNIFVELMNIRTEYVEIFVSDAIPTAVRTDSSVVKKAMNGDGLEPSNNISIALQYLELFKTINKITGEK